jgi:hypothetical protein
MGLAQRAGTHIGSSNGGRRGGHVLWTMVLVLFALWLLGMVSSHTFEGVIHIVLLSSIVLLVFRLLQRRPEQRTRR